MSSLHRVSAANFSFVEQRLSEMLAENMRRQVGRSPSMGEQNSWDRSVPVLMADLRDAGLGGVEVLLEYRLPLSSKRADAVLAGVHPATGQPNYLVVELKQWSKATSYEGNPDLVSIPGYGVKSHPVEQVSDYCEYLLDFNTVLAEAPESLHGVAYLHNATDLSVHDLLARPTGPLGRMYTGQRRGDFIEYLKSQFSGEGGALAADRLLASRTAPSRQLLAVAAEEVQRREMFVLLDEQRDAFNYVLHAVERARRSSVKTAVIVSGGPGSGKSVIALSLLGELARQGRSVVHATGSRSFTLTLRKVAARGNRQAARAFMYFNSFMAAEPNDLECLILDEAHRIRETSANRWTRAAYRTGRPQIEELLAASRVPVFLLDENQVVRPGELGTVEDIEVAARQQGMSVERIELDAQFRCGGSEAYLGWVKRLLGLEAGGPLTWAGDPGFEVRVFDDPAALESWLRGRRDAGYGARLAAGYCWGWSDPTPDGRLVSDVQVGDWRRPWNLKGERSVGGAPAAALWATDPAGFDQVGCVYTAQGFEYDYAGVIIGPDLVWRDDHWQTVRSGNKDPDFRNPKRVSDQEFDVLVRNVYKVLLTRGMLGVGIYSTDEPTRDHLSSTLRVPSE